MTKTCTWEGCDTEIKPHRRGRFCNRHYAEKRRRDAGTPMRLTAEQRGCSYTGCDRPHKARGYCDRHYGSFFHTKSRMPRATRPEPDARETLGVWEEGEHVTVVHWRRRDEPWVCPECGVKVG